MPAILPSLKRRPLTVVGLLLLSGLFLWAGVIKALDPQQFLLSIRTYEIMPDPYAAWLAMGLPWLEILAALGLWWSWSRPGSLVVLLGLIVVFLIAILSALARGLEIDCGCFGDIMRGGHATLIIQDVVLLAVAAGLLFAEWRRAAPSPAPDDSATAPA